MGAPTFPLTFTAPVGYRKAATAKNVARPGNRIEGGLTATNSPLMAFFCALCKGVAQYVRTRLAPFRASWQGASRHAGSSIRFPACQLALFRLEGRNLPPHRKEATP